MKSPLTKIFKTIEILTTQQEVPLKQFFKTSFLLCLFLVSLGSTTYLAAQPNAPVGFVCNNNNSGPGAVFLAIGPNDTGDLCIEFRLFYAETATAPADPLTATEYVFGSTPGDGGGTNPFGFQLTGLMPGVDYTIYIFQYNSCTNEFSAPTSCMVTAGAAGPPATPVGFVCNPTGGDGQVFLAVGPNNVGMNDIVYRLFFAPTASAPADPLTATEHIFGSVPGDGGGTSAFGFTIMGLIPGTDYNFYLYQFNRRIILFL